MTIVRNKLYIIFTLFSIFLISLETAAFAKDTEDEKSIKRAQQYFNNLRSIEANFTQTDSSNQTREGKFFLSRPNKLRLDYNTPQKEMIMLSEDMFIHFNEELSEVSYLSAGQFPISFLSRRDLDLKKDAKILNIIQNNSTLSLELELPTKEEYKPRLTLGFDKNPFNLKSIVVQEPDGKTVLLELVSAKYNTDIDNKTFEFKNPNFFK